MLIFETTTWRQHSLAGALPQFHDVSLVLLFDQVTRAPCNSSGLGVNHADI